jgi:hypothetical protein
VESDKTYSGVLTFTDRTAEIGGTVTTAMGGAASDQTVIIFPEDRTLWVPSSRRIQLVRPDAEGRYTIRSLPAGDYRVAAVLDPESGIQFDRDFLAKQLPLAQQINLAAGERKTQDIRVRSAGSSLVVLFRLLSSGGHSCAFVLGHCVYSRSRY